MKTNNKNKLFFNSHTRFLSALGLYVLRTVRTLPSKTKQPVRKRIAVCLINLTKVTVLSFFICNSVVALENEKKYQFSIPSVSVEEALGRLAIKTQKQLLFSYELVEPLKSTNIQGEYTIKRALEVLLKDTGLSGKVTKRGVILITQSRVKDVPKREKESMKKNKLNSAILAGLASFFSTSESAFAQEDEFSGVLEEVVVTAQKRAQNIMDVGLSVDVVSASDLEDNQITNLNQIGQLSPSVTVDFGQHSRASSVRIRGVGSGNLWSDGIEPSVAVFLDGVVVSRPFLAFASDLGDIERVEVLRGPQGTLFGKNASQGVLNVVTKRPTDEFESKVDITYAEDDELRLRGIVNIPLTDNLKSRIAVSRTSFDGYIDTQNANDTVFGDNGLQVKNKLLQGEDKSAISGKLLWDINDSLEAYLITEYTEANIECCAKLRRGPAGTFGSVAVSDNVEDNISGAYDVPATFDDTRHFSTALEVNWDINDYTLTGIYGYRDYKNTVQEDGDGSDILQRREDNLQGGKHEQNTLELRLQSPLGGKVDYVAGLYLYDFDTVSRNERRRYGNNAGTRAPGIDTDVNGNRIYSQVPGAAPGLTCENTPNLDDFSAWTDHCSVYSEFEAPIKSTSTALFGNANIHLTDALTLTLGARYTDDEIDFEYKRSDPDNYRNGDLHYKDSSSDTDFSVKAGIQYSFNDDVMAYFNFAQGYKGPAYGPSTSYNPACEHGPNCDRRQYDRDGNLVTETDGSPTIWTSTGNDLPIKPEVSDSFELGIKANLFDGHLYVAAALFNAQYDDFVVSGTIDPGGAHINFLGNAAAVETSGFELDTIWKPTQNLNISAGLAVTDATFTEYFSNCYSGQTEEQGCISTSAGSFQDLAGADLPLSPDLKFNIAVSYEHDFENLPFYGFINSGYSWQDEVIYRLDQNPETTQEAYGIANLSFGLRDDSEKYYVKFFIENLTDQFHTRFIETGGGGTYQTVSRKFKRYMGINFGVSF